MLYAIKLLLRYKTKKERDDVTAEIIKTAKKQFTTDDAHIQKHICYHDEAISKECEIETTWHPS